MKKALLAFKNKFDVPDGLAFKSVSGALENLKANTFVCGEGWRCPALSNFLQ
ncbi:MAG: hypothetical protein WBJ85_04975 [Acetomicrobium sp.]|mgnify:FL=1|jgi:hypothetical protein|uniref:hypothetical protein n=1 Tax=Acetomicrobium TaxID=49894 RepID=UPI00168FA18E|nr:MULTISPECIES: hypothetical protein [Acetomicrobium]MDI9378039.1 hypothetical protein [Synergistota bacterium]MDR9769738.1 hypothetical protein [Acetomicrobium sp.]NLI42491.1 hypothetical protein [Synergistaceae bacterium]HOM96932.1 hypothetical protein [Acetomicrobium sp.]